MPWLKHLSIYSIGLILALAPAQALCQSGISTLIDLADQCRNNRLYETATIEYKRSIFFATEPYYVFRANYGLGLTYRETGQWELAEQSFEKAISNAPNDSLTKEATLALAATYVSSDQPSLGILTLFPLLQQRDEAAPCDQTALLVIIAEVKQHNWKQAHSLVAQLNTGDTTAGNRSKQKLLKILEQAEEEHLPDPETAQLLSTILPGTGQFYAGDVKNGVNALALNSLNIWVVINNIIQADYVSAGLYAVLITERYYSGNRYHAEQIAIQKIEQIEENYEQMAIEELSQFVSLYSCDK